MTRSVEVQLEERLGYRFRSPELLERALTHSSAVPELRAERKEELAGAASVQDNERLEFLGDAVLELLAREYLLDSFPEWNEGQLSKGRARLVNAHSLQDAARRVNLGEHLRLGRGEEKTGGREKPALLADAFEAVLAAIYLDGGIEAARGFVHRALLQDAVEAEGHHLGMSDHKSALQELLQARGLPAARYRVVRETGPEH